MKSRRTWFWIRIVIVWAVSTTFCTAQQIQFTSFKATNESTDSTYTLSKPISLNYKETHIIIGFIDRRDSVRARYAYRLVGFDNRWHENGTLRYVNYINLFGGDYELQVRNLNFPNNVASLKFHLDEAFWQRPWFVPMLVAYGLLVAGLIFYLIRTYQLRSKIRLQQIRNEIAADLHDDVGTALSSITFLGEMAKSRFEKRPEDIRPILERIMNESREMMQTMRGVVWVINPQNDNVVDFFDKVKAFAEAVLSSRKVSLTFRVVGSTNQPMGLEAQRNLFLIFKEAVVNIAKHAEATETTIQINLEKTHLWVQIQDNGKGFDALTSTDGNGLRNLKNRAVQIGGDLDVQSQPGVGTTVNMVIPIA
ncbi:histidine kinase [Spirosoma sp.]|uniref:ATP-binding protein n=1 Tax=Spirosoma sp. TaxID=1899569 RepID=UPI003B3A1B11